jgi:uncharacterized BrkB/YihY/UPF0761 family membrane protein
VARDKSNGTGRLDASARAARHAADRAATRARRLRGAPTVVAAFEREQRSGAALLAGGLAYRLFFWLVALGLVVAAAASFWVRSSSGSLVDAAKSFGLSGVAARSAASAVIEGSNARWYLLVVGVVLLLYFGVGAVRALRVTAFVAWGLAPTRLRHPVRASGAFTALFAVGFAVTLLASWVRHHSVLLGALTTVAAVFAFLALAVLVFALLPRAADTDLHSLLPGAALVGCGITAIHLFIAYYLSGKLERSPKLYGTLGASTVVLLGLFLIARVVVAGLFLNAELHRSRAGGHA